MMRHLFALGLALVAVGCGGDNEKPRPANPGACRPLVPLVDYPDQWPGKVDCGALDDYEVLLLDDFEELVSDQGWYVNNDRTAEQDPPVATNAPPHTTVIPGGRCSGVAAPADPNRCDLASATALPGECPAVLSPEAHGAMHIISGNLTNNGGQLGMTLAKCPAPPPDDLDLYDCHFPPGTAEEGACSVADGPTKTQNNCEGTDLSGWEGIVLWARIGPGSQASIKVRVADRLTDDKGCVCNPNTNQNDASDGCDKWGRFITLDGTFRAYRVPFTDLQQGGWGAASPGLDTGNIFSMAVEYGRGAWDLWLDDIGFYRRKP